MRKQVQLQIYTNHTLTFILKLSKMMKFYDVREKLLLAIERELIKYFGSSKKFKNWFMGKNGKILTKKSSHKFYASISS